MRGGASEGRITEQRGSLHQVLPSSGRLHPGWAPPDSPSHGEEGLPENEPGCPRALGSVLCYRVTAV